MNTMDLDQKKYFDRQIKLSQFGEVGQKRLLNSKILVIGAGGLGCPVLQYLTTMGVGSITIIDHDKIEKSNLHRQVLYTREDVGKFKASVASEKLTPHGPWTQFKSYNAYFNGTLADQLVKEHELIIDCTDNFSSQFLIHDLCFKHQKNLIQSSIHKFDGQLQIFAFAHSQEYGCLRCLWEKIPQNTGDCNDNGVMGIVPGIFGSLQANEAIKLLLGKFTDNQVIIFDLMDLNLHKVKYKKNINCNFCNQKNQKNQKGAIMNDISLKYSDINPNDYTWLDIRMATIHDDLPDEIPSNQVIKKTDAEIMHQINDFTQERPFIVICDRGMRSQNLAQALRDHGHSNVYSLFGGFMGLEK
jgi:molybdopterin/thiamine biosynthesis adenylyltransferase/rhodanese-related sulfurtransferase